jgi:hypothetical protein
MCAKHFGTVGGNMKNGSDILEGLCDPGRMLVFVDESGTSGKPLPNLACDFFLMCGVSIPSERYRSVKVELTAALSALSPPIEEFHAAEILNPSRSEWKSVSPETRLHLLGLLTDLLADNAEFVGLCYVSGEQYPKLVTAAKKDPKMTYKTALRKVFFDCLIGLFRTSGQDYAIVADSPKRLRNEIKIQASRYPEGLYEKGVIYADSRHVEGLQLADLAAYMVNRIYHINQRQLDGRLNQFDRIIESALNRVRLIDLLKVSAELRRSASNGKST